MQTSQNIRLILKDKQMCKQSVKTIELLSPAGDMERLKAAVTFGADAVYLGGTAFGMRSAPKNFSMEQLKEACAFAHNNNVKVYITCNTLPRSYELEAIPDFFKDAAACGVDAFIIADIGVLKLAKKYAAETDIHISTQAGIVNYASAEEFYHLGASRVVLARELSLDEIKTIRDKTPADLEIEAFVHGAMCMSFSGRCLLSDHMVGRDANRGDCAQPCRWNYYLMEETRPGEYYPVFQDDNGSYILNSKDLCMIGHIAELAHAGINSFKIEGRAKSEYYSAAITYAYRNAIDGFYASGCSENYVPEQWVLDEVNKISHRAYCTGFFYGPIQKGQVQENGGYIREWDVAAVYQKYENNRLYLSQRNRFFEGDELEVVEPGRKPFFIKVEDLRNADGDKIPTANQATAVISFICQNSISQNALFRKKRNV